MPRLSQHFAVGTFLAIGALTVTSALVPASASTPVGSEVAISTDASYVKANGRAPSAGDAISACGMNRRQQNEPSAAVDPRKPTLWWPVPTTTALSRWPAVRGRASTAALTAARVDRLACCPGYPTDTSPEGMASPLQRRGITNAGDPVQAWDTAGPAVLHGQRVQPRRSAERLRVGRHLRPGRGRYVRTVIVGSRHPGPERTIQRQDLDRGRPRRATALTAATSTPRGASSKDGRQQLDPVRPFHRPRSDVQPPRQDLNRFQERAVRRHRRHQQRAPSTSPTGSSRPTAAIR